ncbi:MAG: undecaprenyl-diphosphate phosphatase [Ruminococcaceae bacterium]|nr:undecaprenyl-diphosphate phosphatase [Oscillospiraceae bacterium]
MFIIDLLKTILQGIVQGITEWLPISSTGHILLLDAVWPMQVRPAFFNIFKVVIQLGSILAVLVLYFQKLNPFSSKKTKQEKNGTWVLWSKVVVASIPTAIVGLTIEELVDNVLSTPLVIAITLFLYGVGFLLLETFPPKTRVSSLEEISYRRALGIGAFQSLSLIPGTSRSGSTILGASLLGTSRAVAAEFSFFMAIPAMAGASGLKVLKFLLDDETAPFTSQEWILLAVGTVVAFVVSLLAIRFLMGYIKKHDFKVFGWYRIALAAVLAAALIIGWL